jgi:hypothetical protein
MTVTRALLRTLTALVIAALVAGCGVSAQDTAEPVPTAPQPTAQSGSGDRYAGAQLTIFLVRGTRLAPAERRISTPTPGAALEQLVEGPTRAEAASGVRTALAPEVVGVEGVLADGVATVSVTRGFTGISGGNQLLAVAQVVWTLTALPTVERVRFTVEGRPVEVPTDAGLSGAPVDADDYRSVTPAEPSSSATTAGPPPPPEEDSSTAPPR